MTTKKKPIGKVKTQVGTFKISERKRMPDFTLDKLKKLGVTIYPNKKK